MREIGRDCPHFSGLFVLDPDLVSKIARVSSTMTPLRRQVRRQFREYERRLGPAVVYLDEIEVLWETMGNFAREKREQRTADRRGQADHLEPSPLPRGSSTEVDDVTKSINELKKSAREQLAKETKQLAEETTVRLEAGDAVAESVDDLRDATADELKSLQFYLRDPFVSIALRPTHAKARALSIGAQDQDVTSLIDDIEEYVAKHRVLVPRVGLMPTLLLLMSLLVMSVNIVLGKWLYALLWAGTCSVSLLPFLTSYRYGSVKVVPRRRREARTDLTRVRRDLFVAALSASVGGIVVAVVTNALR